MRASGRFSTVEASRRSQCTTWHDDQIVTESLRDVEPVEGLRVSAATWESALAAVGCALTGLEVVLEQPESDMRLSEPAQGLYVQLKAQSAAEIIDAEESLRAAVADIQLPELWLRERFLTYKPGDAGPGEGDALPAE